jgi:hypothetical protein
MSGEVGEDPCSQGAQEPRVFDTDLIREPLVPSSRDTVARAVPAMQREHMRGVLVTDDGKPDSSC